jgi:hypothetical protein
MKLDEILGPNAIIELVESYDYIPPDLKWKEDTGYFSLGGKDFMVTLTPSNPTAEDTFKYFFNPVPRVGNIDFSMLLDSGETTQDTTNEMKSQVFKVLGGVAYIASELCKKHNYQVMLCVAKKSSSPTNYQSRVNMYDGFAERIAKKNGMLSIKLFTSPESTGYAVFQPKLHDGMLAVRDHFTQYYGSGE